MTSPRPEHPLDRHVRTTAPGDRLLTISNTDGNTGQAATYVVTRSGPYGPGDPTVVTIDLPAAHELASFTSGWGAEYEPAGHDPLLPVTLEVTTGRSGQGAVPWLGIVTAEAAYVITLHWSGNWRLAYQPTADGCSVSVGLHPDGQQITLAAGETFELPAVTLATGTDLTAAALALTRRLADQVPPGPPLHTEWNHWWPYEDAEIDEDTFLANAAVAAEAGLEVAVLDAGWFGGADADTQWFEQRGDWDKINTARFPHGLTWLADQTRARGLGFGIWLEGEAVGVRAEIADARPELLALGPDGDRIGYLCLGSPAAQAHLLATVTAVLSSTQAMWLKWDFNLDPGAGCRRDDHGHRADDGLLRHYLGLYAVLDRIRAAFPDTVIEACSSGGLRIDAGLAAHVDTFFLSDPDWTEHHLACVWGAARMLPPRQLVHWPQSEWRGEHPHQHIDYSGPQVSLDLFDTVIRSALLHRFGVSMRLTQMRPDLLRRLGAHVTGFREVIRPILEHGELVGLTGQPLREGRGVRQPAFQLSRDTDVLVAAFRLDPVTAWEAVRPRGLDPAAAYTVRVLDGAELGPAHTVTGVSLARDGLTGPDGATSAVWLLSRNIGPIGPVR